MAFEFLLVDKASRSLGITKVEDIKSLLHVLTGHHDGNIKEDSRGKGKEGDKSTGLTAVCLNELNDTRGAKNSIILHNGPVISIIIPEVVILVRCKIATTSCGKVNIVHNRKNIGWAGGNRIRNPVIVSPELAKPKTHYGHSGFIGSRGIVF